MWWPWAPGPHRLAHKPFHSCPALLCQFKLYFYQMILLLLARTLLVYFQSVTQGNQSQASRWLLLWMNVCLKNRIALEEELRPQNESLCCCCHGRHSRKSSLVVQSPTAWAFHSLVTVITAKTCADKRRIRVFLLLSIHHQFSVYRCDLRKS